jgi:trans-2,3-dihydro-3-hydroxyanthranilate isomerase
LNSPNSKLYHVVDVFTERALEGNALAVFPYASNLDEGLMQKIARELNLSETVFVVPATRPEHAARLRIFTPFREIPFAGHPTIGTSFVLLSEEIVDCAAQHFVLEEGVGPVTVRVENGERPLIWLTTPPIEEGPQFDLGAAAEALGLSRNDLLDVPSQLLSAGNPCIFVALRTREAVDKAWLEGSGMNRLLGGYPHGPCVFVFTPTNEGAYSRMFAPDHGIAEDPATGSATGPLAAYMIRHKLLDGVPGRRYLSEQGTKMGRRSILYIQLSDHNGRREIEVGGYVAPFARATLEI